MKKYLYSLVLTAIGGSVAHILAPDGEKNGLRGRVGFVVSVSLVLALASPVLKTVKSLENIDMSALLADTSDSYTEYEAVFERTLDEVTEKAVLCETERILTDDLGLDRDNFNVTLQISGKDYERKIEKITVFLSGKGALQNPRAIENEVSEYFGCDCEVIYE